MKKLMIKGFIITAVSVAVYGCNPQDSCKNCEAVTYEAGTTNVVDRQDATEYCGDDLHSKESAQPVVVGNDSTVWECQ